ncbi:type III pantothenate kinase [Candidatus Bandiella euplotis]|uniref:Type III pantothenate kinase n=1 Tax=Candidatus Bandiella euplotis TaxID=1664265 RepID=A0ABZ0UMS5_9RICK|nr:type III pantothenate kinase [Candidatus Bandiella woodruffii]WPX95983.1 Type III pantothenate kinase [Candidatus Bandiella woodruffii]
MLLVIDAGNTNIVICLFNDDTIIAKWRIATLNQYTEDEYAGQILPLLTLLNIDLTQINGAIISSVVRRTVKPMSAFVKKYLKLTPLIAKDCMHDVSLKIEQPEELGSDILANAIAANDLAKENCIFLDFGTALVIGVITKEKEFLGATISPGIKTAHSALISKADLLGHTNISKPKHILGTNTATAISSGIYTFYVCAVNGILSMIRREHERDFKTVITGGFASIIQNEIESVDFYDPDLTLKGLKLLYDFNK